MEGEFFFNKKYYFVFFCIIYMRIWYNKDLINFWSGKRSHSKYTFFNSNWMCWILCFFFILNNFIGENIGRDFWRKNSCGAGCSLQIARMILIVLAKGSIKFCSKILWVFSRINKVVQAWRKGQKYCSKISINIIYLFILIFIRLFTNSNRYLIETLSL